MSRLRIVAEPHAPENVKEVIREGIALYNVKMTGHAEYHPVAFFLRDSNDEIRGGVLGDIWGGWLYISFLWVDEPLRGLGHATRLMKSAERAAQERGCVAMHLSTFSFQARPLYEKLGFKVFATLENHPIGHSQFFMAKRFKNRAGARLRS